MSRNALVGKITKFVGPAINNLGYELYYLEFKKEGKNNYLRIYIDKEQGNISLQDCEKVSRTVSDILDREDPIKVSYYLEVSSPGVERKLYTDEHLKRYIGRDVVVNIRGILMGKKKYEGKLLGFDKNQLKIDCIDGNTSIPREKISTVNLKGDF
ncbi:MULTISPECIES: ribosome maturation factor RimP [Clostridium]|uniref:Ribosome maturation factor RimP n=1 Tax=Clostridium lapidicellarium TaxID=3240931 RepID=A0ABV4DS96_9CLOT|nr:ribosome maturation factor RimP [uncultured Clostridium sp.]NLU08351.1 ribosome maturation factor RimP [Clostridiales bacterium]